MTFYHGSPKEIKEETIIIKMNHYGYVQSSNDILEAILEKNRPDNKLSRQHSLFVVDNIDEIDNAGGYIDFIYEVDINLPDNNKSDMAWITEAQIELENGNYEAANDCAKKYWSGEATNNPVYEYRTDRITILELVENNSFDI